MALGLPCMSTNCANRNCTSFCRTWARISSTVVGMGLLASGWGDPRCIQRDPADRDNVRCRHDRAHRRVGSAHVDCGVREPMWVAATSASARVTTRAMEACARLAYRGRSMCGIVGLYAKTAATSAELGRHAGRMLVEMGDRGPDSAGLAVYREPLSDGSTKLSLHARDGAPDWDALVARLGRETPVLFHRVVGPEHALVAVEAGDVEAQRAVAATLPEVEVAAAGTTVEIIKEAIRPAEFVERFDARRDLRHPRAGPHPHGDREPRHDRGLASVLDRRRPLPGPQRLALQPQPAAPAAARPGHRVPDRERHRGRRRLRRVAPARRATRWSAPWSAASTTSTASTPSPSARPTASRCCATRSPASRP